MASPTQQTWVWVSSRSWWWTGKPGMLQSMGSQRVGHDWVTELNWLDTAAAVKLLQSCPTLCDPIDCSPPSSPVPGILQARTLEWVAISFSNAGKRKVKVKLLSHVWLFAAPWTAAYQASPPMGFSRQEYWSGLPLPSPLIRYTHTHTHTHTHTYTWKWSSKELSRLLKDTHLVSDNSQESHPDIPTLKLDNWSFSMLPTTEHKYLHLAT